MNRPPKLQKFDALDGPKSTKSRSGGYYYSAGKTQDRPKLPGNPGYPLLGPTPFGVELLNWSSAQFQGDRFDATKIGTAKAVMASYGDGHLFQARCPSCFLHPGIPPASNVDLTTAPFRASPDSTVSR